MRASALALVVVSSLGCASRGAPPDETDAGIAVTRASSPLALVRRHARLASRLASATLAKTDEGWTPQGAPRAALRVVLPELANDPLRLAVARARVTITPLGLEAVRGSTEDGARVFVSAAPSTDLIVAAAVDGVEELRVLHDATAPTTFRWHVVPPQGGALRRSAAGVEVVDERSVVLAAAERPFALDANGVRRDLEIRVDGDLLVATLDTAGLAFPIVVDPSWTNVPSLRSVSGGPLLFALPGGRVVSIATDAAPYVDVFDPATNSWSTAPDIPITWWGARAVQLTDGNVLVVAGNAGGTQDRAFARFNAATHTWTTFGTLQPTACIDCILTRLNDGRVLKIPGVSGQLEIFDPATSTWTTGVAMASMVMPPTGAVTLDDGRVLVVAGEASGADLWNPSTGAWTPAAYPGARYFGARLVKLKDGRVMLVGMPVGSGSPAPVARIWSPTTDTWTATYPHVRTRRNPSVLLLPSGRLLAVGGSDRDQTTYYGDAEIWDPLYNSWNVIDPFAASGRANAGIAPLPGGGALVAGGTTWSGPSTDAFRYDAMADGASCAPPAFAATCAAPYCTDGVCCNSASCPGGTCAAPAAPGRPAGTCAKNLGQACTKNADCASNFCVDGVCCDSACDGQCQACNLPPSPGTCRPVLGDPIGDRPACGGAGAGTACGAKCDGVDGSKCNYAAAGTVACGTDSCSAGVETKAGTCDGAGVCTTTTAPCGAYACGATACKRSCAVDSDCADGHYCSGDKCLPKVGLGSACTSTSMCPSGLFCTDGVCCGVASCGEGSSCSAGTKKGECSKVDGASCTNDAECASGFCTDGVCCNRRCDAQCEACDLPATKGTCSPVSGAPRGARPACDDGGGDVCKALECDGATDPTACTKYKNGGTVVCKAPSCAGSTLLPTSTCDGAGSCVTPPEASCGRYACDPAGPRCRTDCAVNADCAEGFSCVGGVCAEGARCSDDGLSSMATDGTTASCVPYKCGTDGTCIKTCATSEDCAPGHLCEIAAGVGVCKPATPTSDDDGGGCAIASPGKASAAWTLVALGLAAVARGRRRALRRRLRDRTRRP